MFKISLFLITLISLLLLGMGDPNFVPAIPDHQMNKVLAKKLPSAKSPIKEKKRQAQEAKPTPSASKDKENL